MKKNNLISYSLLIFLVIRIIFNVLFLEHDKYYWEDTIHYYTAAVEIVENGKFGLDAEKQDRPFGIEPVYSLFLTPFVLIFGKYNYLSIRIFQSVLFILSSLLFYKTIRFYVNEKFSVLGFIIYLGYPFYIFFSGTILPEGIIMPLLVTFTFFLIKYNETAQYKYYLSFAVIYGFIIHLKVATGFLGVFLLLPFFKKNNIFESTKIVLLGISIVLLICVPWGIRNYQTYGHITLPRSYGQIREGKSEIATKFESFGKREGYDLISNTKNYFSPSLTRVDSKNKFNQPLYYIIGVLVSLPLLLSIPILPFFKRNKGIFLIYLMILFYSAPYLLFQGQTRYRIPIDFVMIILLMILLQKITDTIKTNQIKGSE